MTPEGIRRQIVENEIKDQKEVLVAILYGLISCIMMDKIFRNNPVVSEEEQKIAEVQVCSCIERVIPYFVALYPEKEKDEPED